MATRRMSNADAAWLHMDRPTNLMVVNAVLWFAEPVDRERARDVIATRLVERYPRFRRIVEEPRLGIGIPRWRDDPHFDLERHIHHVALPAPGDRAALEALVADVMASPLDRSKPLWEMYLVDGYGEGSAVISRMHHCIADGIALSRVLLSLTDEQPDAGVAEEEAPPEHARVGALTAPVRAGVHAAEAMLHEGFELLAHPTSEVPGLAGRAAVNARALGKLLLTGPDHPTALQGELGVTRRVAWSDPFPLEDVKAMGHATGTTVNDVLVSALSGALHRYLSAHGGAVDEIRAMVPFNLRPLDQPLPRELGNRFGLVYLPLPVGVAGPRGRLDAVHRRMQAIKDSPEGALSYGILGAIGVTPPQVEGRLIDVFAPKTTLVLTNVPGPRRPVWFAGTQVTGVLGWVPASGSIGVGISIFSYAGSVTVGVRVDAALVPHPEAIVEAFGEELDALRHELATRPRRRGRRAATA